jgi:hypothetical protein
LHGPAGSVARIRTRGHEAGRIARREGNVERAEEVGHALAACFQVGLFAGPAVEETFREPVLGERSKRLALGWREEALCDGDEVDIGAVALQIDPYRARARERVERQAAGVADVEPKISRELRLSMVVVGEVKARRIDCQVAGEKLSQVAAGALELIPILVQEEALGSLSLIRREERAQGCETLRRSRESASHDVDLAHR